MIVGCKMNLSFRKTYWFGTVLVLLGSLGFSAKAVLIKWAYQYQIDFISLLTLRMLFSMPFYAAVAWRLSLQPNNVPLKTPQWVRLAVLGILGYYAASLLDFWGLHYVTTSVERLILFVYPTIVLVITATYFKKKITHIQYLALILTYVGMALAFATDISAGVQSNLAKGATLIFGSAVTYAIYLVFSGDIIPKVGSMKFTCYAMLFAGLAITLNCLISNGLDVFNYPKQLYCIAFLMAMISTVIPTFLLAEGIGIVGADNASLIGAVGPVSTIVMAYFALGERISAMQLLGTTVVLIGVLMISWKGKK